MSGDGPLAGLGILVPRSGEAAARTAEEIRRRGGRPVLGALTETVPPSDPRALAAAADRWNRGGYDWLVVTSARGAAAFAEAGAAHPAATDGRCETGRDRSRGRVAAVGPATAEALSNRGLAVDLQPEADFSGAGIAAELVAAAEVEGAADALDVLLPVSEIASTTVEEALREAGHRPERVTAYRTVPAPPDPELAETVRTGACDAILITSGSVAREVARRFDPLPPATRLVAIGEPTARALAAHGLRADVVARTHTVEGMLDALAADRPEETP